MGDVVNIMSAAFTFLECPGTYFRLGNDLVLQGLSVDSEVIIFLNHCVDIFAF